MNDVVIIRDVRGLRAWQAAEESKASGGKDPRPLGFVPTMGSLHRGHQSLMQAAVDDGCQLVVSIFVNPLQFGPGEDLEAYPRDEAGDLKSIEAISPDAVVFLPTPEDFYPPGFQSTVRVRDVTQGLCGGSRPGHFDGVTTVVARLLGLVGPQRAYFGQKDYQQLTAIRRMVEDLAMPYEIVGVPTVREPDGLALSSRNIYLSPNERRQALALNQALTQAEAAFEGGEPRPLVLAEGVRAYLDLAPGVGVDYVEVRHALSLGPAVEGEPMVIAVAALVGRARLIDNRVIPS